MLYLVRLVKGRREKGGTRMTAEQVAETVAEAIARQVRERVAAAFAKIDIPGTLRKVVAPEPAEAERRALVEAADRGRQAGEALVRAAEVRKHLNKQARPVLTAALAEARDRLAHLEALAKSTPAYARPAEIEAARQHVAALAAQENLTPGSGLPEPSPLNDQRERLSRELQAARDSGDGERIAAAQRAFDAEDRRIGFRLAPRVPLISRS